MAGNESASLWDLLVMQPEMSPQEKMLRDKFVDEYLKDFDAWASAIRLGFLKSVAPQYAQMLLEEPYVRREITRRQLERKELPKEAEEEDRRITRAALMKEAHYHGPGSTHSARVQALAKLCTILDMDAAVKVKSEVLHRGGVMMIPAIANLDEWERAASASQDALVADARH